MTLSWPSPRLAEPLSRIRAKSKADHAPLLPIWFPMTDVRTDAPHLVGGSHSRRYEDDASPREPHPAAPGPRPRVDGHTRRR